MNMFILALRVLSVAFISVAGLHLFLGMGADAMLGVPVTAGMASDPSFDSQNRFYGITFSLLGVALLISATDIRRYQPIIVATLGVLFAAGIARAISWLLHGAPSPALIGITAADLLLPPILYFWLKQCIRD
jgi:Domain of unknown function (DUF4345)